MGGTSTIGRSETSAPASTPSSGGGNAGVGGVRVACTLLGPEGSDTSGSGSVMLSGAGGRFLGLLPDLWDVSPVVRGSTDRMLRTTQWTRASFSSSRHLAVAYLMKK